MISLLRFVDGHKTVLAIRGYVPGRDPFPLEKIRSTLIKISNNRLEMQYCPNAMVADVFSAVSGRRITAEKSMQTGSYIIKAEPVPGSPGETALAFKQPDESMMSVRLKDGVLCE